MILIADSGSSKTDWMVVNNEGLVNNFQTMGLNPYFTDKVVASDNIAEIITESLLAEQISHIYFYGSGCGTDESKAFIKEVLEVQFPFSEISVNTDLQGAAIALFGDKKGIACILGTGANSGLYDGNTIVKKQISLGYILGDEGSGAVIGKRFMASVLKSEAPDEIVRYFYKESGLSNTDIITNIYRERFPNRFLAHTVKYLLPFADSSYVNGLVGDEIDTFFRENIDGKYPIDTEIGFVGSLAWLFRDIVTNVAKRYGYKTPKILRYPATELAEFYRDKIISTRS